MTQEEQKKYWLDIAEYDIDTAEAMYQTGRWLYVAFMCHQVIEKTLKAYWCATQPNDPPYTHNHKRLADGSGLYGIMSEEQKDFLNTISRIYVLKKRNLFLKMNLQSISLMQMPQKRLQILKSEHFWIILRIRDLQTVLQTRLI